MFRTGVPPGLRTVPDSRPPRGTWPSMPAAVAPLATVACCGVATYCWPLGHSAHLISVVLAPVGAPAAPSAPIGPFFHRQSRRVLQVAGAIRRPRRRRSAGERRRFRPPHAFELVRPPRASDLALGFELA